MVGPWPLAPHQDYLQHMYPMYFNASGVKNRGITPLGVEFRLGQHPFGCTSFSIERSELGGDISVVLSMVGR